MLTSFRDEDPSRLFSIYEGDRVDAWAPQTLQDFALEMGFALPENCGDPALLGEAKDLADRIALIWDAKSASPEMKTALLGSLRSETFGCAQGEEGGLFSLALLRQMAKFLEIPRFPQFELLSTEKIPKRVPRYEFKGKGMDLSWSRGKGLSWAVHGCRPSLGLFSLEVQGDRGGLESFIPGLPERPRRFLVAHMRPYSVARKQGAFSLGLRRELRLPQDSENPKGRIQKVDWELLLRGDLAHGSLDALVSLRCLPPGQRVRLLIPFAFFPRSLRWESLDGERKQEGPLPRSGFRGSLLMQTKDINLEISGPGWREMEVYPYKNDHILALTLYRAPREWQAPERIVRRLTLRFLDSSQRS